MLAASNAQELAFLLPKRYLHSVQATTVSILLHVSVSIQLHSFTLPTDCAEAFTVCHR